mgnify:CR=1 FL=1|jgi:hypothetical protein
MKNWGIILLVAAAWFFMTRLIGGCSNCSQPKMVNHVTGPKCQNVPLRQKTCNVILNERSGYIVPKGWETVRENLRERFDVSEQCPEKLSCSGCEKPFRGYITSNRDIYPLYLNEWNPCPRYPVKRPECVEPEFEYDCPKALVCPKQKCTDLNIREPCIGF